jgi:23S rRNA (uracil1939-C5)-methyltransferase
MEKEVTIYGLDSKGRGIGRLHSKPVFVFNALPDEVVEIQNIEEKSKYITADVSKILQKSEKRILPICAYYGRCGGCDIMHLPYSEQLLFKEKKVKDTISKVLKKDVTVLPILSTKEHFYRNKAIFKVEESIGYYGKKSHTIIPIHSCYLVDKKINEILNKIIENISLEGVYEIMIRASRYKEESMVVFKTTKKIDTKPVLSILKDEVTTILLYKDDYEVIYGNGYIYEQLGDFIFTISPDSFFQVNTEGAYQLYNTVLKQVSKHNRVLDLYCGTGSIGIFISKHVEKVFGVEINASAIADANENKKINQLSNVDFLCLNTSMFHQSLKDIDLVIVDPPRSGLDQKTLTYLLEEGVSKMVYVSCDLMTLTRDLGYLSEKYEIQEITPVDLFPNTYHVESVCVLNKR